MIFPNKLLVIVVNGHLPNKERGGGRDEVIRVCGNWRTIKLLIDFE